MTGYASFERLLASLPAQHDVLRNAIIISLNHLLEAGFHLEKRSARPHDSLQGNEHSVIMSSTTSCRAYAAGYCPRGGSCRFSHEPGSRSDICFDFARTGSCRFGARCKFNHNPQKQAHAGKRGKGKRTATSARPTDEIDNFFFTYSEFDYDRSASFMEEFYRMCDFFGWGRDDPDRKDAHEEFRTAMVQEFNSLYGKDIDDLSAWQNLCKTVRILPVPDDIDTCRKVGLFARLNLMTYLMNANRKSRTLK